MTREVPALFAAGISGILVGVALVATGSIVEAAGPITIAFIRYLIGALLLLPFALRTSWIRVPLTDFLPLALLGIFQFAVLIMLLNFSVIYIEVGLAVLIFATLPLLTMTIAILLGREAFTSRKLIGITLTIVGVGFAVGATAFSENIGADGWLGISAAFLSALSGAVCSIFYGPYLKRYPTLQISTLAMLASVIFLCGLAVTEGMLTTLPHFTLHVWLVLLFIGFASAVGYFCWLYGLSHTLPSNVTVFLGLSPISAALFGALFINQPLTWQDATGTVLVVSGLVVSLWRRRAPPQALPILPPQ
ncbi:DMT family transporter [Sneathiella sp.]|uniref:DMT family transporter n=1 Tax=Sneathiella sp. TaxID=1964365 RepID=UPI0035637740